MSDIGLFLGIMGAGVTFIGAPIGFIAAIRYGIKTYFEWRTAEHKLKKEEEEREQVYERDSMRAQSIYNAAIKAEIDKSRVISYDIHPSMMANAAHVKHETRADILYGSYLISPQPCTPSHIDENQRFLLDTIKNLEDEKTRAQEGQKRALEMAQKENKLRLLAEEDVKYAVRMEQIRGKYK